MTANGSDQKDIPTKPENGDPVLAAVGRLEGKVDSLTTMVQEFFTELMDQRQQIAKVRDSLAALEPTGLKQ